MKKKFFSRFYIMLKIAAISFFILSFSCAIYAQKANVVFPEMTIVPNDIDTSNPLNFLPLHAFPCGDINGDGIGDIIYITYAANEKTSSPLDGIMKSLIVYGSEVLSENVYYNAKLFGIGDYNGDGFDDVINLLNKTVYFGCSSGISIDSLVLDFPSTFDDVFFYADINADGYSEFILGGKYSSEDSLLIYSGIETDPIILTTSTWTYLFDKDLTLFTVYDYDYDGTPELCITTDDYEHDRIIKWFSLDKENHILNCEETVYRNYIHEPSSAYPTAFSDINGDGLNDISHVFYNSDSLTYHLEVCMGLNAYPYFDTAVEIYVGNKTRMMYSCGDFNNDGYDDWIAVKNEDTVILYKGNADIITNGLQKQLFYNGSNRQLYLISDALYGALGGYGSVAYRPRLLFYNNDTIPDLYFDYWSFDENDRYEKIGTAIITGETNPDFENPVLITPPEESTFFNLYYGSSVQNVGDFNNDGFEDWGILSLEGCYLDIFYGGDNLDAVPDVKFLLPQRGMAESGDWSSGDLNGDGFVDIVIANSSEFGVRFTRGFINEVEKIYIFFGSDTPQSVYTYQDADVILNGLDYFYQFGSKLGVVGDYNADGYDDIVVGGGSSKNFKKRVLVYFGSINMDGEPDMIIQKNITAYSSFSPISKIGDINSDGYDDFSLGYNSGAGSSLIFFGGPNADNNEDIVINNPYPNGINFGRITSHSPGDFNGDGFNDVAHYDYYKKKFYVYYGGEQLDNNPDFEIMDTTFNPTFSTLQFINRYEENGWSDILINYRYNSIDYLKLYQGGLFQSTTPLYFEENIGMASNTVACGDFNNDGLTEVIVGFPTERDHGWKYGGIAKMYIPANYITRTRPEKYEIKKHIAIYPNPVSNEMNIAFYVVNPGIVNFKIIDIAGKTVKLFSRNFSKRGKTSISFISMLKNTGIYILEIKQSGSVQRKKFIVNK